MTSLIRTLFKVGLTVQVLETLASVSSCHRPEEFLPMTPNETFFVNLSTAVNATIADNQGQGTITDDDPTPSLSIDDVTADEGAGTMTFTISLSAVSGQAVSVDYTTTDGTAIAPDD